MDKRISPYTKIARLKSINQFLVAKFAPVCPFCEEVITVNELMHGHKPDQVTIHHIDENRNHNHPDNLVLTHRTCHRRYHKKKELSEKKIKNGTVKKSRKKAACADCGDEMHDDFFLGTGGYLTCTNWNCKNYLAI